jgi:hypothetical protein
LAELKVAHCSMCGKVFQVTLRNLCNECAEIHDRQYDAVDRYLMKNRQATTEETAEATGVPVKQIREWIRQKKISLSANPNLTDVCDLCGGPSRTGQQLCANCSGRIKKDIDKMLADEQAERERKREHSYKMKAKDEV